jgi:hypothetical protein
MKKGRIIKRQRSPKGLVAYTRQAAGEGEGPKLVEIAPGTFTISADEPKERLRELIEGLRSDAAEAISDSGEDPARWREYLRDREETDDILSASKVLEALEKVVRNLPDIDRATDPASLRQHAFHALGDALALVWQFSAFRLVQHEKAIAIQLDSISFGRKAARAKQERVSRRDLFLGEEFLRRQASIKHSRSATKKSDTIIKGEIGSDPVVIKNSGCQGRSRGRARSRPSTEGSRNCLPTGGKETNRSLLVCLCPR